MTMSTWLPAGLVVIAFVIRFRRIWVTRPSSPAAAGTSIARLTTMSRSGHRRLAFAERPGGDALEQDGLDGDRQGTAFDPGERDQVLDQEVQALGLLGDVRQDRRPHVRRQVVVPEELGPAVDRRDRRAQLVGQGIDVGLAASTGPRSGSCRPSR